MIKQSQKIPDFTFVNRSKETLAVTEFCNSDSPNSVVLSLIGDSGVGKSRFLHHLSCLLKEDKWSVIHVNSKSELNPYSDVIAALSKQLLKIVSAESKMDVLTLAKHRLVRLLRASPQIASAGLKQIPIAGDMLAEGLDQIGDSILNSEESIVRQQAILNLAELALEISQEIRLVLLIDDVHKLSESELDDLAIFLGSVSTSSSTNIRIVIGAQPHSTSNPGFDGWKESVNRSGLLSSIVLQPLSDNYILEILEETFKNPKDVEPFLSVVSGNPQILLDHMIKLNSKGLLKKDGEHLVFPKKVSADEFGKNIWKSIGGKESRRRLIGILAITKEEMSVSNLSDFSEIVGVKDVNAFNSLISQLEDEKILKWRHDKEQNKYVLSFLHEITKTQILQAIISGPIGTRIEFGTIAMSNLLDKLRSKYKNPVSLIKSITTKTSSIPDIEDDDLQLFSDYSDLLFTVLDPDFFAFTLGLIRIANHNEGNAIVSHCCNTIEKYLINGAEAEHKVYEKYIKYRVEAEYRQGNYVKVISFSNRDYLKNKYIAYFIAASYLVLKDRPNSIHNCIDIVNIALGADPDSDLQPQYQLLNAIAHQEIGRSVEAEEIYEKYLENQPIYETSNLGWSTFLAASPLFLDKDRSNNYCKIAVEIARKYKNIRREGIALNNYGFCEFVKGDLVEAKNIFIESETLLNSNAPHEGIFPSNNCAAMDLLLGNFEAASDKLNQALFRTSSENYATTLRVNLAVANFMNSGVFNLEKYDLQIQKAHIKEHTFLQWLIEYNRSFLVIKSSPNSLNQSDIDELFFRIQPVTETANSKLFWNNLMDLTSSTDQIIYPKFDITKNKLLKTGFNPNESLIRPALLLFGRA